MQKEVAIKIGVSEDCITNWENERSIPQIQFYPKIVLFLEYNPFEFGNKTFGEKIKAYRLKNGLSHKRLGKIFKVDASTIGAWESGLCLPRKERRQKFNALFLKLNMS